MSITVEQIEAAAQRRGQGGGMSLPYPPPWMDLATLARHLCQSPNTIEKWSKDGTIPPPRRPGRKLMWKWSEVDDWLTAGKDSIDPQAERIRNATHAAASEPRSPY
jgi:predicted DNA-binding transcriptional regulator AlpA